MQEGEKRIEQSFPFAVFSAQASSRACFNPRESMCVCVCHQVWGGPLWSWWCVWVSVHA